MNLQDTLDELPLSRLFQSSYIRDLGVPTYSCVGNHDLRAGKYGEELWQSHFGPSWYSFDLREFIISGHKRHPEAESPFSLMRGQMVGMTSG